MTTTIDIKAPSPGESIVTVLVMEWLAEDGAVVTRDQPIVSIETEKVTMSVVAEAGGKLAVVTPAGTEVRVGTVIGRIDTSVAPVEGAAPAQAPATSHVPESTIPGKTVQWASPAAAKILREKSIALESVAGTGKDGRVTKWDAMNASPAAPAANAPSGTPSSASIPPAERKLRPGERAEKMTTLRQSLSRRLVAAKNETAMLTTFNEADLLALQTLRRKVQDEFTARHGVKLGLMGFFAKASAIALTEFPRANAFIDGTDMIFHDFVDLSVAVQTDRGLMVPVVRGVQNMAIADIEKEILRLAERARANKLTLDEMSGGTFTISNGGIFGSMMSTPIINPPQAAVLGMHAIMDRPVARDGQVVIRPMMYLALSYDHRLLDGRESVGFLKRVKELLEQPESLLG